MSKTIKLRKGLDIKLVGKAEKVTSTFVMPKLAAIKPEDFHGLTPKMIVKEGETVKAGDVLFQDKYNDVVKYASPVSGTVKEIVRGEKRRILEVLIECSTDLEFTSKNIGATDSMSGDDVKKTMLDGGLWPFVKQRPLDVVANPKNGPKAIFISGFDSAPLAADMDYLLEGRIEEFQKGIDVVSKLTEGKVHLTLNGKSQMSSALRSIQGVQINTIIGKHPAGNVGTQIHHLDPINKGEFVWTINALDVAIIGRFFATGKFDVRKKIALAGSEMSSPSYVETVIGAEVSSILSDRMVGENVRVISGNVLTGDNVGKDGFLGFYHNQITAIPEGNKMKFAPTDGWAVPLGFKKMSNSRLFASALTPNKEFVLDTNTNGEERAFVVTGELERVFPFDILPMQLAKAAITQDIDGMENLGIYEVAPEDFALCEFVCTSKIDIQDEIRQGLDLIAKECM